jgi:hypothetical protein
MVGQNLPARSGELLAMLLNAAQHSEIALIEHRAAVPLGIARASALLLFGAIQMVRRRKGRRASQAATRRGGK